MRNWSRSFRTSVSVSALLIAMSSPARAQTPVFVNGWGSFGTGNTQFYTPVGIALDGGHNVYVCDSNNLRVQKFTHAGLYLTQWPVLGAKGLAVDQSGNVFVVGPGVAQKFTSSGLLVTKFDEGVGNRGVAVGPTGDVYIVGDNRVRKFTNDGQFLLAWGGTGSTDGLFNTAAGSRSIRPTTSTSSTTTAASRSSPAPASISASGDRWAQLPASSSCRCGWRSMRTTTST